MKLRTYRCPRCALPVRSLPASYVAHACPKAKGAEVALVEEVEDNQLFGGEG